MTRNSMIVVDKNSCRWSPDNLELFPVIQILTIRPIYAFVMDMDAFFIGNIISSHNEYMDCSIKHIQTPFLSFMINDFFRCFISFSSIWLGYVPCALPFKCTMSIT